MRSAFDHASSQWGADWSHLGVIASPRNRSWSQMTAAFPDWQEDGLKQARLRPRVTTKDGFKALIGKALRYASLTGPTRASLAYANELLRLGSADGSESYFRAAVSLFKSGIPEKNIEPAIYSVGLLQGMQAENKLDFDAIRRGSGNFAPTRQGLARAALSDTERESYRDGQQGKLALWWRDNKKWAFPVSMGVAALVGIGIFFRVKGTRKTATAPAPSPRRRRAR